MQNCVYVEMLFVTKGSFFLLCKERTLEEEACFMLYPSVWSFSFFYIWSLKKLIYLAA